MPSITNPQKTHSPLAGGIPIWPRTGQVARGTLTAVARRNTPNRERVLVTCVHVVSTGSPTLFHLHDEGKDEGIYHGGIGDTDKIGELYVERDASNSISFQSWSVIESGVSDNPPDVAALQVLNEAATNLGVHFPNDDDNNHTHSFRPIVAPSVSPREGMSIIRLGSTTGQHTVPIHDASPRERLSYIVGDRSEIYIFPAADHFILNHLGPGGDQSKYSKKGDSGAPLLWEDDDGNLRMVGIHVTSDAQFGKAIPATLAERHLQVYFGVRPPTVNAGDDLRVATGGRIRIIPTVTPVEAGSTITSYKWEVVAPWPVIQAVAPFLSSLTQKDLSFNAPDHATNFGLKLVVTDSNGAKASNEVRVTVGNHPPIALAGRDKLITAGHRVTLEGSVSDPDAADRTSVTHAWTQDDDNPATVTLARVEGRPAQRTFTPSTTGDYTFTLTATDPYGLTASDTVKVKVLESSKSIIPTNVSALPADRSVDISWTGVSIATGYELQVGVAEDGGEIGYASYPTTALTHRVGNLAHSTRYHYRVRATYNGYAGPWSAASSTVTSTPANHIPVSNAGADQKVNADATVTLDLS